MHPEPQLTHLSHDPALAKYNQGTSPVACVQHQYISGNMIDVFNFDPEQIDLYDILWNLGFQCRYGGNCAEFLSVLEHCLMVARITKDVILNHQPFLGYSKFQAQECVVQALLHDAEEAYMPDTIEPVKQGIPKITEIGNTVRFLILQHFKIHPELSEPVRIADQLVRRFETPCFMPQGVDQKLWDPRQFGFDDALVRAYKTKLQSIARLPSAHVYLFSEALKQLNIAGFQTQMFTKPLSKYPEHAQTALMSRGVTE